MNLDKYQKPINPYKFSWFLRLAENKYFPLFLLLSNDRIKVGRKGKQKIFKR